jgi:putative glycosyltransferase (TIGR04372 family)
MGAIAYLRRQVTQLRRGGRPVIARKARKALRVILALPFYVLAIPVVIVIRQIRPRFLIRLSALESFHLGHFAGDTELSLCERDAGINRPGQRHVDLFYIPEPICNQQLATMWRRVLRVWPEWILSPIRHVDRMMPGDAIPESGDAVQGDRDVHNLLDRVPPHLIFTPEEEARGEAGLRAMGISRGKPFVCLNVRDNAYNAYWDLADASSYVNDHSYRDSDIQNYVLAAETLADRGYVVIRMGAIVREAIKTRHPGVIDYAANGMRSDFMDIYLGAKCEFCVSVGSGFDAVPMIFRRPIACVNFVPLGRLDTFSTNILSITKHYHLEADNRELTLAEIFARGVGFFYLTSEYQASGIRLIENTPEEIRDLVVEMAERLEGTWQPHEVDEALQGRFWEIFPKDAPEIHGGSPWHGEIRARFGAAFLRGNRTWFK